MSCGICASDSSVDSIMLTCAGCPRKFHAVCVGVPVQRNSLRKRDKTVDTLSYMLPCCSSCQNLITASLEFNTLAEQQARLTDQINEHTEVFHRFAMQQEKPSFVHEALERLDILLAGIKSELSAINRSSLAGGVVDLKNHVTAVFDTAIKSTNERISTSLKSVTTDLAVDLQNINATLATKDNASTSLKNVTSSISTELRNINNQICELNQRSLEIAATCAMKSNSMLEIDILDELKSLSANIASVQSAAPLPSPSDSCPSLEVELNNNDDSGWRLLGTRKVWKADWSDYDARELHRSNQQKIAEKARRRRKRKNARTNTNNHNSSFNHRNNNNSNNSGNSNNNQSNNYRNNYNTSFNNTNRDCYPNRYGNHCNTSHFVSQNGNSLLPPDRELLAAAKDRFSRPPTNYRPTIQFQRGEILNPYPARDIPRSAPAHSPNLMAPGSSPAAACEACICRHSCFPRN